MTKSKFVPVSDESNVLRKGKLDVERKLLLLLLLSRMAPSSKFINNVFHDTFGQIYYGISSSNSVFYGNICFNNGYGRIQSGHNMLTGAENGCTNLLIVSNILYYPVDTDNRANLTVGHGGQPVYPSADGFA